MSLAELVTYRRQLKEASDAGYQADDPFVQSIQNTFAARALGAPAAQPGYGASGPAPARGEGGALPAPFDLPASAAMVNGEGEEVGADGSGNPMTWVLIAGVVGIAWLLLKD